MIRELELALVARLRGTDQVPAKPIRVSAENILTAGVQPNPLIPVAVAVTMQLPDEWVAQAALPAVNLWRYMLEPDPTRFRVAQLQRPSLSRDGVTPATTVDVKNYPLPFKFGYEVGIRTRFQQHMVDILQAVHQRMPPMGFGSTITVADEDGDVEVPFRQVSFADLTEQTRSGEREMEIRLNYEMLGWLDPATWMAEAAVRTIVLATMPAAIVSTPTGLSVILE